jgi:hypothetical protein
MHKLSPAAQITSATSSGGRPIYGSAGDAVKVSESSGLAVALRCRAER